MVYEERELADIGEEVEGAGGLVDGDETPVVEAVALYRIAVPVELLHIDIIDSAFLLPHDIRRCPAGIQKVEIFLPGIKFPVAGDIGAHTIR